MILELRVFLVTYQSACPDSAALIKPRPGAACGLPLRPSLRDKAMKGFPAAGFLQSLYQMALPNHVIVIMVLNHYDGHGKLYV